MARPVDLGALHHRVFFLGGGYKYARSGEEDVDGLLERLRSA